MKRTLSFGWLPISLFQQANPLHAVIVGLEDVGDETLLRFEINKTVYQMSLWGQNLNTLINKFGEEDSKWLGQKISIARQHNVSSGKDQTIIQ